METFFTLDHFEMNSTSRAHKTWLPGLTLKKNIQKVKTKTKVKIFNILTNKELKMLTTQDLAARFHIFMSMVATDMDNEN